MNLKYVVKKTVFGFDGTKKTRYVGRSLLAGNVSYSILCDQVTKQGLMGALPHSTVKMVMDAMIDVIGWNLTNHMSVKLHELGSLRPAFRGKSQEAKEDVTAKVLNHRKILFTPTRQFKNVLDEVSLKES